SKSSSRRSRGASAANPSASVASANNILAGAAHVFVARDDAETAAPARSKSRRVSKDIQSLQEVVGLSLLITGWRTNNICQWPCTRQFITLNGTIFSEHNLKNPVSLCPCGE